jgi:hypothetical protein
MSLSSMILMCSDWFWLQIDWTSAPRLMAEIDLGIWWSGYDSMIGIRCVQNSRVRFIHLPNCLFIMLNKKQLKSTAFKVLRSFFLFRCPDNWCTLDLVKLSYDLIYLKETFTKESYLYFESPPSFSKNIMQHTRFWK